MSFDYYATLAEQKICPPKVNECALASGIADGCLVWSCQDKPRDKKAPDPKNDARLCYMKRASDLKDLNFLKDLNLPPELNSEPDFSQLPDSSWFGIKAGFELLSPWYSKDDRPFHVLDNPVRKDKVFGVPFMSAASWKGLLRWACGMNTGLVGPQPESDPEKQEKARNQLIHLFGNERAEVEELKFSRGALQFYPTWFDKVGFEVINPHSRKTRAGTQPIYYEVVPAGTQGKLQLLYAPLPGQAERDKVDPVEVMTKLVDSIQALFEKYGISAKRTAGWGAVGVKAVNDKSKAITLHVRKGSWFEEIIGTEDDKKYIPPEDKFKKFMDDKGRPLPVLLDEESKILSKTQFKKLGNKKPDCTNADFENFSKWYKEYNEEYGMSLDPAVENEQLPAVYKREFGTLADLKAALEKPENVQKGGNR